VEGTGALALELGDTVTLTKDATGAFTEEHMHTAVELNGPLYAESVPGTAEVAAALKRLGRQPAMSQVFELAAFTVREGHQQALLAERKAMLTALGRVFPGLMSAWLTQRDDGSWLDVILWHSREQAENAAAHVTEVPEAAAWFSHIDQARGIEHLEVRSPKD
jgi:hypothetical protein